jgi:hypothetical protein
LVSPLRPFVSIAVSVAVHAMASTLPVSPLGPIYSIAVSVAVHAMANTLPVSPLGQFSIAVSVAVPIMASTLPVSPLRLCVVWNALSNSHTPECKLSDFYQKWNVSAHFVTRPVLNSMH